ncbi:MAG: 23S rRNA (pseudouridine(1915)-N(3))-methyltransferase RlmH [Syntrophomonadaceae bacterium]|jgi:23S rRNA (pseudouridine1915-N3)-methyltransferase
MKYRIISVGKIKDDFYLRGINEYLKRLRPYVQIEMIDSLEEKLSPHAGAKEIEKVLDKEGAKILALINDNDLSIAMDIKGKQLSSEELAGCIEHWNMSGKARVNFIIGASYGLSAQVKQKADQLISFSRLTFPHHMAVLILSEQLYRGFKILKGEPYHK